ncbi:MAG: Ig-like domain-containing protein [Myxococcales bacterium]
MNRIAIVLAACLVPLSFLVPHPARAASLALDQGPVILGRVESVGVTIRIDEAPGSEDRPLRLAVNVGSFGVAQRTGPGTYRAVYVPPTTRFPQVALVAVWKETGPEAPIEFLRIPLHGVTKVPVQAPKKSQVRLQVRDEEFGPVTTDRFGKAVVTVDVPPNVREATILAEDKHGETTRRIPIEVPAYNRLTAALVPHSVVADGHSPARLEVFYDLGGADVPATRVKVAASVGEVVFERAEQGRYVYRYLAPSGATAKAVSFKVSVDGDAVARAEAKLNLGLPPPAKMFVRAPERALVCDGTSSASVFVMAFDATGLGLASQKIDLTANGQKVEKAVYRGNGTYEFTYLAPKAYPSGGLVQFIASDQGVTAAANYQLQAPALPKTVAARLTPSPVPLDGRTEVRVDLDVRDAAGQPLPGAQLTLVATEGQVSNPQDLGEGRYQASFVPPASSGESELQLRVVDITGTYDQVVPVPLRADPHRLLLGVRGGFSHNFTSQLGPRAGADLWIPIHAGTATLGLGVTAEWGSTQQTLSDSTGSFTTQSTAHFVPIQLRLAYELYAGRRLNLLLGVGGIAAWARYETSLSGEKVSAWGFGGMGYLSLGLAFGPGHAFLEVSYGIAPVSRRGVFRLDAAGFEAALGYRFGVF